MFKQYESMKGSVEKERLTDVSSHHDGSSCHNVSSLGTMMSVKIEPDDDHLCLPEQQAAVKIEVEIDPDIKEIIVKEEIDMLAVVQPPGLQYVRHPYKQEAPEDTASGASPWSETRDDCGNNTLHVHLTTHQSARSHYCEVCKKCFPQAHTCKYSCDICLKRFTLIYSLKRHMKKHMDERTYRCDICDKCFIEMGALKSHMAIHTGELRFRCGTCSKRFARKQCYMRHVRTHSNERPYCCEICKKDFKEKYELKKHLKTPKDKSGCADFERVYLLEDTIDKEKLNVEPAVTQSPGITCAPRLCELEATQDTGLGKKIITEAQDECGSRPSHSTTSEQASVSTVLAGYIVKRPHCCEICRKSFKFRSKLKDHMTIHTGEQAYCCEICQKRFTQSCNLITHMKLHSSERAHCCAVCEKTFSRKSNLSRHLKTHSIAQLHSFGYNEKDVLKPSAKTLHGCTICLKEFSQKSNLNRHMSTHTNERPYPCQFCERSFTEMARLNAHMTQHTGQQSYSCDICSKNFSRKDHLVVHMNAHINKRPYFCKMCKKSYKQKSHLESHMRIHKGKVSSLRAEAAEVCSPEDQATIQIEVEIDPTKAQETVVKEEMDIEPTVIRPADIAYVPRPFKKDSIENNTLV